MPTRYMQFFATLACDIYIVLYIYLAQKNMHGGGKPQGLYKPPPQIEK
jgi:hypothetical protein